MFKSNDCEDIALLFVFRNFQYDLIFFSFIECDDSCKSTCWEAGPKGCDECNTGWTHSEEEGCVGKSK